MSSSKTKYIFGGIYKGLLAVNGIGQMGRGKEILKNRRGVIRK